MVVGNGLVAQQFDRYRQEDHFLVFASGVSNSKTQNPAVYEREMQLLREQIRENDSRVLVYFSTCSIYDPQEMGSVYVQHKLQVEELIRSQAEKFLVFRISNLAGRSANPNTLLNYFFNHIRSGVNFDLWTKACRNIIDAGHAYLLMDHILQNGLFPNQVINIANPVSYRVMDIVLAIENYLDIRSNFVEVDKGACFDIDLSATQPLLQNLELPFGPGYLERILQKYYPHS